MHSMKSHALLAKEYPRLRERIGEKRIGKKGGEKWGRRELREIQEYRSNYFPKNQLEHLTYRSNYVASCRKGGMTGCVCIYVDLPLCSLCLCARCVFSESLQLPTQHKI